MSDDGHSSRRRRLGDEPGGPTAASQDAGEAPPLIDSGEPITSGSGDGGIAVPPPAAGPNEPRPMTRLDLRRFNVGDVASTFLYASAINTVMAEAAESIGSGVYIGAAFVVILLLDWLSRVFVMTNFPGEDQGFRSSSWLLIIKLGAECVCVTLITAIAVTTIKGQYQEDQFSLRLLWMFGIFAGWNYLMIGVLKHVDFKHIVRAVFQGYDGASGVFRSYLKYFDALLCEIREEAAASNSRVLGASLKMTGAMLVVLFLCVHILVGPWIYAFFAGAMYLDWHVVDLVRVYVSGRATALISLGCIIAFFSAAFAANAARSCETRKFWRRPNLGSVVCCLSILVLMFLVASYVEFRDLLWVWFIQVSIASFLIFFMSQERVPPATPLAD